MKAWEISLLGPRPLAEAISTAGGVRCSEFDENLMIHRLPGAFVAGKEYRKGWSAAAIHLGELIDWEAPTGGYLIQGCLATGTRAAKAALAWKAARTA